MRSFGEEPPDPGRQFRRGLPELGFLLEPLAPGGWPVVPEAARERMIADIPAGQVVFLDADLVVLDRETGRPFIRSDEYLDAGSFDPQAEIRGARVGLMRIEGRDDQGKPISRYIVDLTPMAEANDQLSIVQLSVLREGGQFLSFEAFVPAVGVLYYQRQQGERVVVFHGPPGDRDMASVLRGAIDRKLRAEERAAQESESGDEEAAEEDEEPAKPKRHRKSG